jgi:AraC-like DNA-binding protein
VLAPGALLLGNEGTCFECGHEHGRGDRCLSFHFASDLFESVVAAVPGARRMAFAIPRLPPSPRLMPLLASLEAACDMGDGAEFEELALRVAGAAAAALADADGVADRLSRRDERRVTDALRRIEAESDEPLALRDLAREARMSPYHFLRIFKRVAGLTPHQFVLRTRLHRAAVRLRRSDEPVSGIAFEAGFNDLSTFNRRFRQIMGVTPTAYRTQRGGQLACPLKQGPQLRALRKVSISDAYGVTRRQARSPDRP